MEDYFRKKKLTFLVSSQLVRKMQYLRGLYLLTGHNIGSIPNITEMIDGALFLFYIELNRDMKARDKDRGKMFLERITRSLPYLNVETELDEMEYDNFVKSVIIDKSITAKTMDPITKNNEFKNLPIEGSYEYKSQGNEQINMIIKDEQLEIVKGINILLNEIRGTRYIYSTPDIIREVIGLVFDDIQIAMMFMDHTFIGSLYEISPIEHLKFYYRDKINLNIGIDLKKFEFILSDKPLVRRSLDLLRMVDINKKILAREYYDFLYLDSLRSYVSDFDYPTASKGFALLHFILIFNLNYPDFMFDSIYGLIKKKWDNNNKSKGLSYEFDFDHRIAERIKSLMIEIGAYMSLIELRLDEV